MPYLSCSCVSIVIKTDLNQLSTHGIPIKGTFNFNCLSYGSTCYPTKFFNHPLLCYATCVLCTLLHIYIGMSDFLVKFYIIAQVFLFSTRYTFLDKLKYLLKSLMHFILKSVTFYSFGLAIACDFDFFELGREINPNFTVFLKNILNLCAQIFLHLFNPEK